MNNNFKCIVLLFLYSFIIHGADLMNKRSLVYPFEAAKIQVIFGAGFPVALEDTSVTFGYTLRKDFKLPINSTDLTREEVTLRRKKRDVQIKWIIYKILARVFGKGCILRTICEISKKPFAVNNGLFEEIFHIIFTPSATNEKMLDPTDREYHAAEINSKEEAGCSYFYPDCDINLVNLFSE